MNLSRDEIGLQIAEKIKSNFERLKLDYQNTHPLNYFCIDDLLSEDFVKSLWSRFPKKDEMVLKKSLRELKYISAQMNKHDPILEEIIYAFQHPKVVELISQITGLPKLEPDHNLYAGGISMMGEGHFLNPHLDNSHDIDKKRYRVLNLLFYVSPDWQLENGGNLELWPNGPEGNPITVFSKFNRLVVMATSENAWHSVSKIKTSETRCCVSNYYFSEISAEKKDYFHVTSFRGRPEEPIRDIVLRLDIKARMFLRRLFPKGAKKVNHYYRK